MSNFIGVDESFYRIFYYYPKEKVNHALINISTGVSLNAYKESIRSGKSPEQAMKMYFKTQRIFLYNMDYVKAACEEFFRNDSEFTNHSESIIYPDLDRRVSRSVVKFFSLLSNRRRPREFSCDVPDPKNFGSWFDPREFNEV